MPLEGRLLAIQSLDQRVMDAWKKGNFSEAQELNAALTKYESMTDQEFDQLREDYV